MLAATAVKDWLAANNLPGRVRYYGCPAEEGGAGKAFMVRDGVFADVDAAISWHPFAFAGVMQPAALAYAILDFSFAGRSAHAAGSPHLGRSALDAVELMSVGVNYLREHIPTDCRIHYAYLNAGGPAPNIVQAAAVVRYIVRSPRAAEVLMLIERVKRVADGAALMSETQVEPRLVCAMNSLLGNHALEEAMAGDKQLLLAAQRRAKTDDPSEDDIFAIGTVGHIIQLLRFPKGPVKVLVEGRARARIKGFAQSDPFFVCDVEDVDESSFGD